MHLILQLFAGRPAADHRAVFHAFADGLGRMLVRRRPVAPMRSLVG